MNTMHPRFELLPLPLPLPQAGIATLMPDGLKLADAAMLAFNFELHDLRGDAHQPRPPWQDEADGAVHGGADAGGAATGAGMGWSARGHEGKRLSQ